MSVVEIVKLGRKYMLLWPERVELADYFAEYQAVKMSRLVCKYLPGVALFSLIMQLYFGGMASLPQSVVYTVFMLSVPLQALVMLGLKADKFLPPALAAWYKEGVAKINQNGGDIKLSVHKPRYLDLAQLLNVSFRHAKH
ncbi:terminus macrodomain insulation protein YfbV [Thalassotalea sediminis]|uniref:terminus macrodomain insulation protein YfbV n=1 Tax=Thalassotalea sediminis TaxID=1759089 RepID=UPI00257249CF|nr:terminus macrodomain insulation protein YfbV [Thalassotalea sediminis]